jgi:O-antigen/teichoic acid export membrane protein
MFEHPFALQADRSLPAARILSVRAAATSRPAMSLRANFSWTFAGNVIYAACQWGMLSALARLGSPELVGQFALALAVTSPVFMLANLQLRGVQATDARSEYTFSDYVRVRLITTVIAVLSVAAIALAAGYSVRVRSVIVAVAIMKAIESISDVVYGSLQQRERMDRIAISLMLRGVTAFAVLTAIMFKTSNVLNSTIGVAFSWALVLVAYDLRKQGFSRSESVRVNELSARARMYKLVTLSWPLGAVMMLVSLNVNIPRYALEHYRGTGSLGLFAAVAYVLVAGTTVITALGQSTSPRLAQQYNRGDIAAFRSLLAKLIGFALIFGGVGIVGALLGGRLLMTITFGPEYAKSANVLFWMMVAAAVSYVASFFGYAITAARRFLIQAPLFIGVAVITGIASIVLVPRYGALGAALAMLISSIAQLAGSVAILSRALKS